MIASATSETVANEARMMRTNHRGALLICEGSCDKSLLKGLIDGSACKIIIAHTRDNAEGAARILDQEGFHGYLALVDSDFDKLQPPDVVTPNTVYTDKHDVECTICSTDAFERLVGEFILDEKRRGELEDEAKCPLRDLISREAAKIGYVRWLSKRNGLNLKFTGLKFSKFTNRTNLAVDLHEFVKEVRDRSQTPSLNIGDTVERAMRLRSEDHDVWQVACGHDVTSLLSYALQRIVASHSQAESTPDALERSLRLCYRPDEFRSTEMHAGILEWQNANGSYRVLHPVSRSQR
jgi:hypothetical protein